MCSIAELPMDEGLHIRTMTKSFDNGILSIKTTDHDNKATHQVTRYALYTYKLCSPQTT